MSTNEGLEETELSYDHRFVSSDNPRKNIWNNVKTSSKIEQD